MSNKNYSNYNSLESRMGKLETESKKQSSQFNVIQNQLKDLMSFLEKKFALNEKSDTDDIKYSNNPLYERKSVDVDSPKREINDYDIGDISDIFDNKDSIKTSYSRRQSQYRKHLEESDIIRILPTREAPKFDHIKLVKLTVSEALKFSEAVMEYEKTYQIRMPVWCAIGDQVRMLLCAKNTNLFNFSNFHTLSNEEIYDAIRKAVQPAESATFIRNMEKLCKFNFPPNFKVQLQSFPFLYEQYLIYSERFKMLVQYMTVDQDKKDLPDVTNKDGGLIKRFLSGLPNCFSKHFYGIMKGNSKTYTSINTFIDEFSSSVHEYGFKPYESVKPLAIMMKDLDVSLSSLHVFDSNVAAADFEDHDDFMELNYVQEKKQDIKQSENVDYKKLGCYGAAMYGKCTKEGCKLSHESSDIRARWKEMHDTLKKSKYASFNNIEQDNLSDCLLIQEEYSIEKAYLFHMANRSGYKSVHTNGVIHVADSKIGVESVLMDSGALDKNYICPDFINQHLDVFGALLRKVNSAVRLGDSKTKYNIDQEITLTISFTDENGAVHTGRADFQVFRTGYNIIMGLPGISAHFTDLFISMLKREQLKQSPPHQMNKMTAAYIEADNGYPMPAWSTPIEEAPEEADEHPVNFGYALHFMEMSVEEANKEYETLFEKHVSAEMINKTKVIELLKGKGRKVFIPQNWEGIRGFPDLELKFKPDMPKEIKPKARFISPRIYQQCEKEFKRLMKYFYRMSTSPIASNLVVAPKATPPFIRFCGCYIKINQYILTHYGYIPNIQYEIMRIMGYKIFMDIDLVNAFHQRRLAELTSAALSLITPWGQVEPRFMPEGISPATAILQEMVRTMFSCFDWVIFLYDNLLLLAYDYDDAYAKLDMFFDRCIEYNVFLKFSKSYIGFSEVKFFGYICRHDSWELGEDRKNVIDSIPFPTSQHAMRSFLGMCLFFKNFLPHYSTLSSNLNDMIRDDFNWSDKSTWTCDYEKYFLTLKSAILHSLTLFFPNYDLKWILRSDSSMYGIGAVLLQVFVDKEGKEVLQPIAFVSQKYSEQATKWSTIKQECYSIYYSVKKLSYYLIGKQFVIQTDHRNLLWMEASDVAMIIRWRVYLQGFVQTIEHISGTQNHVADYFSRVEIFNRLLHCYTPEELNHLHAYEVDNNMNISAEYSSQVNLLKTIELAMNMYETDDANTLMQLSTDENSDEKLLEALNTVHNGRTGHWGARRTWMMLNKNFPGHKIPFSYIQEFINGCAICQKDRIKMVNTIPPIYRTIKQTHARSAIGVDNVSITPADIHGNDGATVVINLFTRLTGIFPYKSISAPNTALAIVKYMSTYGKVDTIYSDPGCDFTSTLIADLNKFMGTKHMFSLVDRHQSNGAERVIQEILRHLKALCFEERVQNKWSDDTVLPLIQYIINSSPNSESGSDLSAFILTMGSSDNKYYNIENNSDNTSLHKFVQKLDENLTILREISSKHQAEIVEKRKSDFIQNFYQPGDLVLKQVTTPFLPNKLAPNYLGPYKVIKQYKNDVEVRHLALGKVETVHVEKLKLFIGNEDEALKISMNDADQHMLLSIDYYRGFPEKRSTMEFFVRFLDGEDVWLPITKDLSDTTFYENFCASKPELRVLLQTEKDSKKFISNMNKQTITGLNLGDKIYYELRSINFLWYNALNLPNPDKACYVVECVAKSWSDSKHTKFKALSAVFGNEYILEYTNYWLYAYGYRRNFDSKTMILVDNEFVQKYPQVLKDEN